MFKGIGIWIEGTVPDLRSESRRIGTVPKRRGEGGLYAKGIDNKTQ